MIGHAHRLVDGDREGDAHVAAALAVDLGVDADHFALQVDEWAARVAGVDGHVGLDQRQQVAGVALLGGNDAGTYLGLGQIRDQQKRYEEAVNNYTKAIDLGARFGGAYIQLATAQVNLNRYEDAVKTYEKALEKGVMPKSTTYYNIACVYSLGNQTDKAFEMLNKAIDEGFANRNTMETDTDLTPIRSDSRFQQLLTRLSKNTTSN